VLKYQWIENQQHYAKIEKHVKKVCKLVMVIILYSSELPIEDVESVNNKGERHIILR